MQTEQTAMLVGPLGPEAVVELNNALLARGFDLVDEPSDEVLPVIRYREFKTGGFVLSMRGRAFAAPPNPEKESAITTVVCCDTLRAATLRKDDCAIMSGFQDQDGQHWAYPYVGGHARRPDGSSSLGKMVAKCPYCNAEFPIPV